MCHSPFPRNSKVSLAGIHNLRFKPTYNPYTEPSMEIFAYHEGLEKWVEIGNSGMFRPEMLLPMGLPADVNVAGYGLSLERYMLLSLNGLSSHAEILDNVLHAFYDSYYVMSKICLYSNIATSITFFCRPTMIRYGIDNIRALFGPKVDLQMVYENPICRLDEKRLPCSMNGY